MGSDTDEKQQPVSPVPKPGQMSLWASCLPPPALGDLLLDCWLLPTSNLLPYKQPAPLHLQLRSPTGHCSPLFLAMHLWPLPGQGKGHVSSICSTTQAFHGCLCHLHTNSRPAIAFPALSPTPDFRDSCVAMCTGIHVDCNIPVSTVSSPKEELFQEVRTRWWWW